MSHCSLLGQILLGYRADAEVHVIREALVRHVQASLCKLRVHVNHDPIMFRGTAVQVDESFVALFYNDAVLADPP